MGGFIKNFPRFRIILQYLNPNLKNPIGRKKKRISLEILAINHDHHPSTIKCSSNHRINNKNQTRQQNTLANLPTKTKTTLNPQVFQGKIYRSHFTSQWNREEKNSDRIAPRTVLNKLEDGGRCARLPRARTTGTRQPYKRLERNRWFPLCQWYAASEEKNERTNERTLNLGWTDDAISKMNGGEEGFAYRANGCATVSIILLTGIIRMARNVAWSQSCYSFLLARRGGREGGRRKKKKSTHHYRLLFVQNTTPTERINVVSEIVPLCKHISIRYRPAYLIALHFFPRPLLNLSLLSLLLLRDREIRMNPRSEMLLLFHEKKETPTWRILNTCTTPFFKRKQRGRGKKREKRYISFRDKAEFICSEWITLTDVLAIHHPNAKWPRRRRPVIRFASAHIPRSITAVVEKHAHAKDNYALIALNLWNNLLYNAGRGREKRGGERGGGRAYSDRTKGDGARRGETRSVGRGGFAPPKEEVAGTGSRPIFRISRFSTPSARLTLAYRFKDNLLCRVSSFQSRETRKCIYLSLKCECL